MSQDMPPEMPSPPPMPQMPQGDMTSELMSSLNDIPDDLLGNFSEEPMEDFFDGEIDLSDFENIDESNLENIGDMPEIEGDEEFEDDEDDDEDIDVSEFEGEDEEPDFSELEGDDGIQLS